MDVHYFALTGQLPILVMSLENDVGTYSLLDAATDKCMQEGSCAGKGHFN